MRKKVQAQKLQHGVEHVVLQLRVGVERWVRRVLRERHLSFRGPWSLRNLNRQTTGYEPFTIYANRLRALHPTRPHTVGYRGECDQEKGEIECPV